MAACLHTESLQCSDEGPWEDPGGPVPGCAFGCPTCAQGACASGEILGRESKLRQRGWLLHFLAVMQELGSGEKKLEKGS